MKKAKVGRRASGPGVAAGLAVTSCRCAEDRGTEATGSTGSRVDHDTIDEGRVTIGAVDRHAGMASL